MNKSIQLIIDRLIEPIVLEVRKELAKEYDINDNLYYKYTGLCDIASKMIKDKLCREKAKFSYNSLEVILLHGEQKHSIKLNSRYWYLQHTWCMVKFSGYKIYVDATSSQFQNIYNDIPDYYISPNKPKWFYWDGDNPVFGNKFFRYIDKKIKVTYKYKYKLNNNLIYTRKEGIVTLFEYYLLPNISDKINEFIKLCYKL